MFRQFLRENKYLSRYLCYSITTGIYGIARSFNTSYEPPNDILGTRLELALRNGILYTIYAPYYQMKLINRIHIKLSEKDPSKYKDSYQDMFSYNMNVFI